MTKMIQVLYSSKLIKSFTPEVIEDILKVSRKNNAANEVSGMLLFRDGDFLQLLEGDKMNVYYTLKKIRDDKRHSGFKILHEAEINTKIFDKWSMAFKNSSEINGEMNEKFSTLLKIDEIKSNLQLMDVLNKFYYS